MKIGFVFECGPRGADRLVCEYLAAQLRPDATFEFATLSDKETFMEQAAETAKKMVEIERCDRVLLVWDLRPAWPDMAGDACRKIERDNLLGKLQTQALTTPPVFLVCIEKELESWLLADENLIERFLSTDTHRRRIPKTLNPDRADNPKSRMMTFFRQAGWGRYDDKVHAIRIIQAGQFRLNKLKKSLSFARFYEKITH